jgi:hypothetical protein
MTPNHELRRLLNRQNLDSSDAHYRRFARQMPQEWREPAPRRDPPAWLWAIVYAAAALVLWLYGF